MAKELTSKQKFQMACITGEVQDLIDKGAVIADIRSKYGVTYHSVRVQVQEGNIKFPKERRGDPKQLPKGLRFVMPDVSLWTDGKLYALCKEW